MSRLSIALGLAGLLALGAGLPARAADDAPPPGCRAAYDQHWEDAKEGLKNGGLAAAEPHFQALKAACGDGGMGRLIGTVHAEARLQNGDAAGALDELTALNLPDSDGIKPVALWIELAARARLGDGAAFTAARDRLLDLAAARLTDPAGPFKGRLRERFETEAAVVDVYDLDLVQGAFRRRMLFVARPKDGGMFVSGAVTLDMAVEAMGLEQGKTSWFLDLYPCDMHATLTIMPAKKGALPDYAKVKAVFAGAFGPDGFKARIGDPARPFCAFEAFMAPGFYPPGEDG